ncbi:MAG: TlpA disulfide reductase family protein [Thermodesulfobacteriota bacterium]
MSKNAPVAFLLLVLMAFHGGVAMAGAKMPHFSLEDAATGKAVDSSTYAGKAKLVVFFATWCMPCMQEVPALVDLQKEYGEDGFTVIAISVDKRLDNVQSFIKKQQINYPVLIYDEQVISNFGGIPGLPTTFMVDKKDNVLKKYPGLVPHALLEREVKRMLEIKD